MGRQNILNRVRNGLADLIRPKELSRPNAGFAAAKESALSQGVAPEGKPTGPVADFEDRLRRLLAGSNKPQLAGAIHLVGMAKIRAKFGPAWEQIAARADQIARKAIERRLVEGDFYYASSAVNYLIVFPTLNERQAQLKCRLIGEEIAKALLGSEGADGLEVKSAVIGLDGTLSFAEMTSVELTLEAIADPARSISFGVESAPRPVSPTVSFEEVRIAPKAARRGGASEDLLSDVAFVFCPMWRPSRNLITSYLCQPLVPTSDVGSAMGSAELAIAGDDDLTQRLDEMVLNRGLDEIRLLVSEERKVLITVPIHFETVAALARRRMVHSILAGLPEAGQKLLAIELVGVPDGVPQSRLIDLIGPLRPRCSGVALLMSVMHADFSSVRDTGAAAVCTDITTHAGPELVLMQHMNRFLAGASKAGLPAYIRGVRSRSLAAAAVGAGFVYIEGEAIGQPLAHPKVIREFNFFDMFSPA
jgi:hypothetical protein